MGIHFSIPLSCPTFSFREVKNKVTGVDIYVSDYQEVPHRLRNDYLYHVIVVSNLFYYKKREHRESDVVQFMVSWGLSAWSG